MMAYTIEDVTECHALNKDIMMAATLGTREEFEEFDRAGVPWSNGIAFVGHNDKPDPEHCRRIREKGASTMAGTSRNLDRALLAGRVASLEPQRGDYRATLETGVDIVETDVPRELGPVLHDRTLPSGPKAKFFRLPAP